jgi:Pyridine nucleotide-disulphide oxidoreductase
MTTELERHQSFPGAEALLRVPLRKRTALAAIRGSPRVEEVELTDLDHGATDRIACDTVVFTGDWIPDHEVAVSLGVELDPGTRGPRVDTALRTARTGIFAVGNLLQGAEPADVAALTGRHAAGAIATWLAGAGWPERFIRIDCRDPLRWIAPSAVSPDAEPPPRGRFLLRSDAFLTHPRIEIRQGERLLWSGRLRRLVPGRSASLPAGWITEVDTAGSRLTVTSVAN